MNNLDDLIHDIHTDEALPIDGSLDAVQQWRIEEHILQSIKLETTDTISSPVPFRFKPKRRKWLTLALAAVLLFTLGITAIAAVKNEWDIQLINFMGISNADTLQLEGGEVQINKTATYTRESSVKDIAFPENPIQIKAISSIGDKNSAYIRIETDYEVPASYNEETDYFVMNDLDFYIEPMESGFGMVYTSFIEDGKLGFLMSVSNCENLNRCEIYLQLTDLYLYHDLKDDSTPAKPELICPGTWTLEWKFNYKSNMKTYRMFESIESNGVTYYLTKVEISPISVRLEAFRMPQDRQKEHPNDLLESLYFEDGSILTVESESSSGVRNGIFIDSYIDVSEFGNAIDADAVKSITICGKEIKLH